MIGLKKLHPDVNDPIRTTEKAVGYDLYAYCKTESDRPNKILIPPRATRAIPTGLIIVPPVGYSIFLSSRSGMARDRSIFVPNAPAIIDPDYRGELTVLLYNGGIESHYVQHGDRVGQMILLPWKPFGFYTLTEVLQTERGDKGFGSSGR